MADNFDFGNTDTTFDSAFNGGLAKVYRLHNMLNHLFQARSTDDHIQWESSINAIYDEIWPYLDEKKDDITKIEKLKIIAGNKVLNYLKWEGSTLSPTMKVHLKQSKQKEVENALSEYMRMVIRAMKNHNMDLPGTSDPTRAVMRGRY